MQGLPIGFSHYQWTSRTAKQHLWWFQIKKHCKMVSHYTFTKCKMFSCVGFLRNWIWKSRFFHIWKIVILLQQFQTICPKEKLNCKTPSPIDFFDLYMDLQWGIFIGNLTAGVSRSFYLLYTAHMMTGRKDALKF